MSGYDWRAALSEVMPSVVSWRRALHRRPELSSHEKETRAFIMDRLAEMGIPCRTFEGCYAVMATLRNGEGPCVAIRADMDALPVTEQTGLPFASEVPGVMHACGHDTHMAMALGSALWLSTHLEAWHGTVKWLFEPEEETVGGGQKMVAQGCMEAPDVDCVIGQHVDPARPAGIFHAKSGAVSGSSDELRLTVRGTGCHGAYPEKGVDAIVLTAQIVTALQTLVSRSISPFQPAVITFGTVEGGKANNIIADEVRLTGTLRTLDAETRAFLRKRIAEVCEGIARSLGGSAELTIVPSYGAVINDERFYQVIEAQASSICGQVVTRPAPSLGVESFCYFEDHTPGVYYDLGSGPSTALHSPTMVVDEDVLYYGVAMQCASVIGLTEAIA